MAVNIIRKFLMKKLMKPNAEGIMKIPEKGRIDFSEHFIKERLFTNGIDHRTINSERQLENILQSIDEAEARKLKQEADRLGLNDPSKNKFMQKPGEVIEVDFDKGRWNKAGGGLAKKLIQEIIRKYKGRVDDRLLNQMLADDNPQRLAEVMATVDEALIMQQKGMKPDQIVETVKESFKRKKQAHGGRTGLSYLLAEDTNERVPLKDGHSPGRRKFLKIMGGLAALPVVGKFFKFAKPLAKTSRAAEVITTPAASGKPEWFDPLVTRIINEGEDVTKQFAYKERMKVHTKPISETEEVTVYRDLDDNSVRVNYGSKLKIDDTKPYERGNIARAPNDPDQIDLIVREGEVIEPDLKTGKGGGKTKASFEASEAEPRAVGGPEDADIEFDGTNVVDNVDDLMQDVSSLEEFATGKKLTGDKAAKAKKKQEDFQRFSEDNVAQAEYLENKYGPAERYYDEDFASGGIARMLGE